MALRYCFEQDCVIKTLDKSMKNDLAVIDPDGIDPIHIRRAVGRGVHVYGYLNAGALEKERSYYNEFDDLRLAKYDGWPGEYWVDVTADKWKKHLIDTAKGFKELGIKGLYFDNCDVYYMCLEGFRGNRTKMIKPAPRAWSVYVALKEVIEELVDIGLVVMPNGGDTFVRKLINNGHRKLIKTVNQESVLYSDNKPVSKEDTKYFTEYLDWCHDLGIYVRGIEYCKRIDHIVKAKQYYRKHGWQAVYISKHHDLKGD